MVLDTADSRGEFLTDVGGEIALLDPHGRASRVPLLPTAPGRVEGWWPAPERGSYNGEIVLRQASGEAGQPASGQDNGGEPLARQFLSAAVPYPDEFLLRPVNEVALRRLAEGTGGRYDPAPGDLLKDDTRTAGVAVELWPWLLGLAVALFVFDVAAKRWPDDGPSRVARPVRGGKVAAAR